MTRVSNAPALKLVALRKLRTLPEDTDDASVVSSNAWRGRGSAKGISKGNPIPTVASGGHRRRRGCWNHSARGTAHQGKEDMKRLRCNMRRSGKTVLVQGTSARGEVVRALG